jgi:hypothetical protein
MHTTGVNSVWARDLVFGAWNFHNFRRLDNFRKIRKLFAYMVELRLSLAFTGLGFTVQVKFLTF